MKVSDILQLIESFKKDKPFTLQDLKAKFPEEGNRIFSIGVMWNKIEPTWKYKPTFQDHATPYFIFV